MQYARPKGTTTTQTLCRGLGDREHARQTIPTEKIDTRKAPEPSDNDSKRSFIRYVAAE
jgi:hypothetical protein